MPIFYTRQGKLAFKQQLNVAVTIGVMCFALLSSLLTSWQGGRQIRATMIQQGERIAENLASQSVLALLYGSPENAKEAVDTTLLFPDVTRVEVLQRSGAHLILRDKVIRHLEAVPLPDPRLRQAYLEEDSGDSWRFVAPVLTKGSDSPFDLTERKEELLGFVRVVQSKATLTRMLAQVFFINLVISLLFAAMFLLVVRRLAARLTRPITELSDIMARAEQGETNVRAQVSGPRDIVEMAKAFNSMIAALQEREGALRESQARYREVVDSVKEVIFQTDAEGTWVLLNATWQEITGIEIEQALGRPASSYMLEDDCELFANWQARLRRGEVAQCRFVARFRRRDGSVGWLEVAQNSRYDANGRFAGTSGTLDDITALKQTETDLIAAKEAAERATVAKSRFLAALSHDLRQPLTALTLYIGVLETRLAPSDAQLAERMRNCAVDMREMLNDLLDLSKLDAGVVATNIGDFALSDILAKVVSSHAPEANAKGLRLRFGRFDVVGRTDPVLFHRILGNLISNAIRYTHHGGVLAGCRRRHGRMWVEVWDTGVGIPANKTAEIFEEFRQLGNDERNRAKGTGLGLAIVARMAALLGLQVRVQSRPGKGSLFAVELPLGTLVPPVVQDSYTHRPLRIALVEDNAEVAAAVGYALMEVGHQVVAAASRAELLARLEGTPPDIVISDYRLVGEEDGFDVIDALRARFGDDLQAIIITGDTDPAVLRRMAETQISVYHKPLDFEALRAKIAELTA